MTPIRILIADDHPLFRDGVRVLLTSLPDVEVVGEAGTGEETIDQALTLQPDVILMDLQMPSLNGIQATRRILATNPDAIIIVLTMFEDDDSLFAALRAGARGYVLKGADQTELLHAIQAGARGEALFGATIAHRLTNFFAMPHPAALEPFPELTDREREILTFVAQGYNNGEIAKQLVLSPKTIRNHISNIFSKLQVADRSQAIVRARRAGLGETVGDEG